MRPRLVSEEGGWVAPLTVHVDSPMPLGMRLWGEATETGALQWRQEVGEPPGQSPHYLSTEPVLGDQQGQRQGAALFQGYLKRRSVDYGCCFMA